MEEFGNAVGLTRQSVSNYESGTRIPGSIDLAKICDACGCTSDWLLGRSDTKSPSKDIQSACHTTGLNEKAVTVLSGLKKNIVASCGEEVFIEKGYVEVLSEIIEAKDFQKFIHTLTIYYIHAIQLALSGEYADEPEQSAVSVIPLSLNEENELVLTLTCDMLRDICKEAVKGACK